MRFAPFRSRLLAKGGVDRHLPSADSCPVSKKGPTVTATPEDGEVRPGSVRGVYNTSTFETVLFGDKPLLAVGRRDGGYPIDVPLDDDQVSRLHCVIRAAGGDHVTVTDLSKNGTVLGRARIRQTTADLHPGDVLRVGGDGVGARYPGRPAVRQGDPEIRPRSPRLPRQQHARCRPSAGVLGREAQEAARVACSTSKQRTGQGPSKPLKLRG
jgi:hypothetical protein